MKVDRKMLSIGMILFVLYHVLILAIPFAFNTTFFIAWMATLVMFVIAYAGYHKAFRQGEKLESKLLGFPVFDVACSALGIQLVLSLMLMALSGMIPVWVTIVVEVFVLGLSAVSLIAREIARDVLVASEEKTPQRVETFKSIRAFGKSLEVLSSDPDVTSQLVRLNETLSFSDPVSSENTAQLELEMKNGLMQLQQALTAGDSTQAKALITQLGQQLHQRNVLAKASKHAKFGVEA